MSGKTYISQLQKQLDEEKAARQNLETELEDLKKISSEITSELSKLKVTSWEYSKLFNLGIYEKRIVIDKYEEKN